MCVHAQLLTRQLADVFKCRSIYAVGYLEIGEMEQVQFKHGLAYEIGANAHEKWHG